VTDHALTSRDATSGETQWTYTANGHVSGSPFVAGSTVYAGTDDGHLSELDLATGELENEQGLPAGFEATPDAGRNSMSYGDGVLLVPTGKVLNAFAAGDYTGTTPPPTPALRVSMPNRRYAGDVNNYLTNAAHNNATGYRAVGSRPRLAWSAQLNGRVSSPLITPRRVMVTVGPGRGSEVASFARASGRLQWSVKLPGGVSGSAVVAHGSVYVQTVDGLLLTINVRTGRLRRTTPLPNDGENTWIWSSPPTAWGRTLYIQGLGAGGRIYAVSQATGRQRWVSLVDGNGSVVVNRRFVAAAETCESRAFRRTSGALLWRSGDGCSGGTGPSPVLAGGRLFAASSVRNRSLVAATGEPLRFFTSDFEPVVVGSLMFTVADGVMRAEDVATHRVLWTRTGDFVYSPLVVGRRVYGVTSQGSVVQMYALTGHVQWTSTGHNPTAPRDLFSLPQAVSAAHGTLAVPEGNTLVVFRS
jgi:outer membrane protein assembly factor BamB